MPEKPSTTQVAPLAVFVWASYYSRALRRKRSYRKPQSISGRSPPRWRRDPEIIRHGSSRLEHLAPLGFLSLATNPRLKVCRIPCSLNLKPRECILNVAQVLGR